jgi:hypothetical protein
MQRFLDLFISVNCSTCFRRFLRPSSGAQNCTYIVSFCQTITAACCYRGWDGTPWSSISSTHHASISLKYNQQHATFPRSIYLYKFLYMFQVVPPSIIRSRQLYIQRQVLSNQYCCLLLSWMRRNDSSRQQYWFDNTWRCMYSCLLLMMDGWTAWNVYSNL